MAFFGRPTPTPNPAKLSLFSVLCTALYKLLSGVNCAVLQLVGGFFVWPPNTGHFARMNCLVTPFVHQHPQALGRVRGTRCRVRGLWLSSSELGVSERMFPGSNVQCSAEPPQHTWKPVRKQTLWPRLSRWSQGSGCLTHWWSVRSDRLAAAASQCEGISLGDSLLRPHLVFLSLLNPGPWPPAWLWVPASGSPGG